MTDVTQNTEGADDAKELITFLEEEQRRLKDLVNKAAGEWEFSEAKALARAYAKVSGRLRVLRTLLDPDFARRANLYRTMVGLEALMKERAEIPQLVAHYSRELKEINRELDEVEGKKHWLLETQHIDDAIFSLVAGEIESFTIHINRTEGLAISLDLCDDHVRAVFRHKKKNLFKSIKKHVQGLGFVKTAGRKRRYAKTFPLAGFRDAQQIKQALAAVLFDALGPTWIDRPAQLEIAHKQVPEMSDQNDQS